MAQMPDSFKPIDMPDSFQPISVESPQLQPSSTSGLLKGGILDPNVSLLDKAKNVLFGQKTDTAGHELQGPGMQEIPGIATATDKLQHLIDPTESPFYTGVRPALAGAVKLIGGTLASGFDPRTAGIKASDAVPPRELSRPQYLDTSTELLHGTQPENAAKIRELKRFDVSQGTRQYDYSVGGPESLYFTTDPKSGWLSAEGAGRGIPYSEQIKASLTPDAKIANIDNYGDLDKLAKKAGFIDGHDFIKKIQSDDLLNPEYDIKADPAANAIKQFQDRTGVHGLNIQVGKNLPGMPEDINSADRAAFSKAYDKYYGNDNVKLYQAFGGDQVIVFDKSKVKPQFNIEVPKLNVEDLQPSISASLEPPKLANQTPAVQKLQQAVEDIKPLNKQQQDIYTLERSQRLAKMKGVSTPGEAGYQQQLGTLKGPMDKVSFEPLKLDQNDVDSLFDTISAHPAGIGYNEIKAKTGLAKILSGQVPQKNEIDLLTDIFGEKVTTNLIQNMPAIDKAKGVVSELVNLPKSLMASFDMSAPFRQGLGLAHKKEFWTSFDDMVKAFGSEDAFNAIQDNISKSPNFQLSQDAGLHLSNLTNMTNREEAFMSSWAERIPGVGRVVRASDRAYVGFLNKLRSDTFSRLVDDAESASKSLQLTAKDSTELAAAKLANPKTNAVLANEMANFVNTATGRGNLGSLEPSAVALNNMFFSPRLIASRVRMLNPQTYIQASPAVRKEYIKSLLAIASVGATVTGLGKAAGGETTGELIHPSTWTSSDVGKMKFGDTRLDPYGGFQQYVIAATRLITGQETSSTSGNTYELGSKYGLPTRLDVLKNFTANKLAPVPKFAYDLLNANKQQPFSFSDESARLFVPMVIQDVIDLANSNPKLIPALGAASGLGMGVQTYPQPGITTQIGNLIRR